MHLCLLKLTIDLWLSVKATECLGFADIEPLPLLLLPPAPEILQSTTPSPPGALPLVPSSSGQTSPNPSQVSRIPRIFARLATSLVYLDSTICGTAHPRS